MGETSAADDSTSNVNEDACTSETDPNDAPQLQILNRVVVKSSAEAAIVETQQNTWPPNYTSNDNQGAYRTVRSSGNAAAAAAVNTSPPIVTKMAERVRLRRAVEEHKEDGGDGVEQPLDVEVCRLAAQLDHARAQNALLALTLDDAKEQSNR